jgi:RNA polymerase sigma-70 factor (ECF subfamily)
VATSTEEARLESLFYEHFSAVRAYTRRRAPEALVDDVVAETFFVAWRKIDHLPDDVRPWLLGVARKTLSTQLRGARRRISLVEKLKLAEPAEAAFSQVDAADSELVESLKSLPPSDQEILALAAWEELKPREAAVVLGVSPSWYRVRLHRAKRRLLRDLERSAASAGQPLPVPLPREGLAK